LICFDPGGQSDRVARLQQPHLDRLLGQKVIIDYKVGGGGALDGESWYEESRWLSHGRVQYPHTILQPLQQEVGYKTEQINPICLFQRTPLDWLFSTPVLTRPFRNSWILGRKNPGALTSAIRDLFRYHMAALRFEKLSGVKLTYVPFTGSAPQMTAFLGGHLAAIFGASDDLTRFRDKLRVLGLCDRSALHGIPRCSDAEGAGNRYGRGR